MWSRWVEALHDVFSDRMIKRTFGVGFAVAAALLGLGLVPRAQAAVLNTSPFWASTLYEGSYHACTVVNIGKATIPVTVKLIGVFGEISKNVVSLATNEVAELAWNQGHVGFARCRFSVKDPTKVRANISVYRHNGTYLEVLGTEIAR